MRSDLNAEFGARRSSSGSVWSALGEDLLEFLEEGAGLASESKGKGVGKGGQAKKPAGGPSGRANPDAGERTRRPPPRRPASARPAFDADAALAALKQELNREEGP